MRPVLAGIWKHHETFDGTYNAYDLADAHELLDLKNENLYRARLAQEE